MAIRLIPPILSAMTVMAALAFSASAGAPDIAQADAQPGSARPSTDRAIDYNGFIGLSWDTREYRADRLVSLEDFKRMAAEPDTIILDTRSAAAFEMGHIDGAAHLNFSDLTEPALARVIPDRDTRILIYCNNNFEDNTAPVLSKSPPLALNVPTFITLVGYGYDNVYELGELVSMTDERVGWVSAIDIAKAAPDHP